MMRRNDGGWTSRLILCAGLGVLLGAFCGVGEAMAVDEWTLIGWNNLGMHCMDAGYGVFSLLPPFNTIHAQLVDPQGNLVRNAAGVTVTYEAIADPDGSINSSSAAKTDFWDHVDDLFGVSPGPDEGLFGAAMPGARNLPQPMSFDAAAAWFVAEGIPITPYDDDGNKNFYPLMRLVARDSGGNELATTDIVLPVSDEMDCKSCHASGSSAAARPRDGWVQDPDPDRDMRLNILRLHDDREMGRAPFDAALARAGYSPSGLYATVTEQGRPILCARCHASEALPGSGYDEVSPLTQAIHRRMAFTIDPSNGLPLEADDNRSACYRCHPGSLTRCLRGAMGAAVGTDGTLSMQCQNCHGSMLDVADPQRTGWLDEPACQSCHSGTAVDNAGLIRFSTVFAEDGTPRRAVDATFAVDEGVPAPGYSLYRFSTGHGGLYCAACHGSTHAEFPSSHRNDNLQSEALQGYPGVLSECTACHPSSPRTVAGGPHGLHPLGQSWIEDHGEAAEDGGATACRACHGEDYRGSVLSRARTGRRLSTDYGSKQLWRGFQVGCFLCHLGPSSEDANPNRPAEVVDAGAVTTSGVAVEVDLAASDRDGDALVLRVVEQSSHGRVGLVGRQATYFPDEDFVGSDSFTFAAWDGASDSNLGRVTISVEQQAPCPGDCDGDGRVSIAELVTGVNIALGRTDLTACSSFDANEDSRVSIAELVRAVHAALDGC